jgi:cyanophycinase
MTTDKPLEDSMRQITANWHPAIGLLCLFLAHAVAAAQGPHLLLAGGALPVCSSTSVQFCVDGKAPGPAPLSARWRLDAAGISRIADSGWMPPRTSVRDAIVAALRRWHQRAGDQDITQDDVEKALAKRSKAELRAWRALADFEKARVFDALERKPTPDAVALADSTAASGAAIYREFVAMAAERSGRRRPHVLISTASGRDPFVAIDYYLEVFNQAGAEVRWLPLDQALRVALNDPQANCPRLDQIRGQRWGAHDRDRLYPERAAELALACAEPMRLAADIEWADGVFLNGGDQSFTRASWFDAAGDTPSVELELLLQRLRAGAVVLGGTSAGTAVQSARANDHAQVMMVSGPALPSSAATALRTLPPDPDCAAAQACGGVDADALLYHPGGGLGSFPFGVLDTHFSNRGREYRLARLLLDTDSELGVGIDETTALRLDRSADGWRARVIGRGGVTVLLHLGPRTLLRQRASSGAEIPWPPLRPESIDICAEEDPLPVSAAADSDALRAALDAVDSPRPRALTLIQGSRRQAAGAVCAGTDPGTQIWRFAH